MGDPSEDLYQGSWVSKFLYILSIMILLWGLGALFVGHWRQTIICVILHVIIAYTAYRFAGGKENPELYTEMVYPEVDYSNMDVSEMDLFNLIAYGAQLGDVKIGFHSLRSQKKITKKLKSIGIKASLGEEIRPTIRSAILKDRDAFDICREFMVIQTIHGGKVVFWDGYMKEQSAQRFHEAEIIIDIHSSVRALVDRLLELGGMQ